MSLSTALGCAEKAAKARKIMLKLVRSTIFMCSQDRRTTCSVLHVDRVGLHSSLQ